MKCSVCCKCIYEGFWVAWARNEDETSRWVVQVRKQLYLYCLWQGEWLDVAHATRRGRLLWKVLRGNGEISKRMGERAGVIENLSEDKSDVAQTRGSQMIDTAHLWTWACWVVMDDRVCIGPSKKALNAGIDKLCNDGVVMREVREVRVSVHEKESTKTKCFGQFPVASCVCFFETTTLTMSHLFPFLLDFLFFLSFFFFGDCVVTIRQMLETI